jgi:hypothetical protein
MHTRNKFAKPALLAVMGSLLLSLTTPAVAESDAVRGIYLSAANVPTNIKEVYTYPDAPKGFNPLTASDVELASYGFPQRPDKHADPDHYRLWERAMIAAKIHWHGELKPLHTGGQEMVPAGNRSAESLEQAVEQPQTGPKQISRWDTSGVILDNRTTKWSGTKSYNDIWSVITVPLVQLPFGSACSQPEYNSVSLVGIDGQFVSSGGPTVFVPGESAAAWEQVVCGSGSFYYATIGWGENFNVTFTMNQGDLFYTELHAFGGCNNGSAFVEDLTTLTYGTYTIDNPCSFQQIGRFANWNVWRPCCNGNNPYQLANTYDISYDGAAVLNGSGAHFYPGSQAATTTIVTMTDDAGDQAIELVNQGSTGYQGLHSLWFNTTGCAFTGGCNP